MHPKPTGVAGRHHQGSNDRFRATRRRAGAGPAAGFGAVLLLSVGPLDPCTANAATLRVPEDFATIQAAVDASEAGDSVVVGPGTYRGPGNRSIHFPGHELVVTSAAGAEETTLDVQGSASNPGRGFLLDQGEGPETILDGFTIVNGWMSTEENRPGAAFSGDGEHAPSGSAFSEAAEKHDLSGGGFKVNLGSPTIRNLVIKQCHSEYTGGGASIEAAASPRVSNVVIQDCSAGIQGGGMSVETGSVAEIENCVITGNRAPYGGGLANHASVILVGCTIAGNRADFGGGVALYTFTEGTYERTIISGNCAEQAGREIWSDFAAGGLTLSCCIVDVEGVVESDPNTIEWNDSVSVDPEFCAALDCADAPFEGGDFSPGADSPVLPVASPCGALVGALEFGACNRPPIRSWGRIKARFLDEGNEP